MDPLTIAAAATAIQEVLSLIQQYAAGDQTAGAQLQRWLDSVASYKAAEAAFDAAGKPA